MDESKYEITNKINCSIDTSTTDLGCILHSIFNNNRKQLLNILSISRPQSMYTFIQGIKNKIKQHPIDEDRNRKKRKEKKNRPNYRYDITMGKIYLKFKY